MFCECGCGAKPNSGKRFIKGHNQRLNPKHKGYGDVLCKCGCGTMIPKRGKDRSIRTFVNGHNRRQSLSDVFQKLIICEPSTLASGCWVYPGCKNTDGYCQVSIGGERKLIHHLTYLTFVGDIPVGCELDHLCRTRNCANFEHLEAVPHRVNVLRGTGLCAQQILRTHCPKGHEYTTENTWVYKGKRHCRICGRIARSNYRQKVKNASTH